MILWLVLAAMTALALALILPPLMRRQVEATARLDHDVEVYRDQLAEIDRDLESRVISADEAEAARIEIRRRLLAVADGPAAAQPAGTRARHYVALAVALVLPIGALVTYFVIGTPQAPDEIAARSVDVGDPISGERQRRVETSLARVEADPNDAAAWIGLGDAYVTAERAAEAVRAYEAAINLDDTTPHLFAAYGEALTLAADGTVTPAAKTAFQNALFMEAGDPRARYYLGLWQFQSGRPRAALDAWAALERDSPPDAPWLPTLQARIEDVAAQAEIDQADLDRRPPPEPGPTQEEVASAAEMSAEDRQAMIESMVGQLAARLGANPDDLDGWLRLSRSYEVLGRKADALNAMTRASELAPSDTNILAQMGKLAYEAAGTPEQVPPAVTEIMNRVLATDPEHPLALWFAGAAAMQAGNPGEARDHWTRLLAQLESGTPQYAALQQRIDALAVPQ